MSLSIENVLRQTDAFFGNAALALPSLDSRAQEAWAIYAANPVEGIKIDCSFPVPGCAWEKKTVEISRNSVDGLLSADGELMFELIRRLRDNPQDALYWLNGRHEAQAYELIFKACKYMKNPA